jgi:predicted nucleotidyltransferase
MNTIGIIAEFNPFHNGHLHLIQKCIELLHADRVIVIMSGDFTQRGAPAFVDKFTRTKMALSCGADVVLELPIYYALGSAEYFAQGAVSTLNRLGCIDYLCFGSECADLSLLTETARILNDEPVSFRDTLSKELKKGLSYAAARQKALMTCLEEKDISFPDSVLSCPNNILGIEYIRALLELNSPIKPFTIKREGEDYNSEALSELPSARAIRAALLKKNDFSLLSSCMPPFCLNELKNYHGTFADSDDLSVLLHYKLLTERSNGYTVFQDVNEDLSNKIISNLEEFTCFGAFCEQLKSKDIAYSRISRVLCHILLNITSRNMDEYKNDGYTSYARILGMKKASSDIVKEMKASAKIPVIGNLKEAKEALTSDFEKRLFDETLTASILYFSIYKNTVLNEYRMPLILV